MAHTLPMVLREASAIHTARQTSQLQRMPRKNAGQKSRLALPAAVFKAATPTATLGPSSKPLPNMR